VYQLKLFFKQNREILREYLENYTGKPICLSITDNTASMLSVREKKNEEVLVRLHWMFLHADNDVIREIGAFVRNTKRYTPSIGKFIRDNRSCIRRSVRPYAIKIQGRCHNLKDIFDTLNKRYFHDGMKALITWGKKRARWYKGKRTLGSYDKTSNLIKINPLLDQKSVPRYFVEFVVYHEMIHADMQSRNDDARNFFHNKEFKKREQLFEKYEKAIQWEKRYLR
jgi:hypothetical protein